CIASHGDCCSAGVQVCTPTIAATATSSAVVIGSMCTWESVPGSSLRPSTRAAATAAITTASPAAPIIATFVVLHAPAFPRRSCVGEPLCLLWHDLYVFLGLRIRRDPAVLLHGPRPGV